MPERARSTSAVPEPREGMVVRDPASPLGRWLIKGVTSDGRIDAQRIDPPDGMRHSWDADGWARAWQYGWLEDVA